MSTTRAKVGPEHREWWEGTDFSGSRFGSGCFSCAFMGAPILGLIFTSLAFLLPMLFCNHLRADPHQDGKCTKMMATLFPLWGAALQLAALLLYDFGCIAEIAVKGKRRGQGYWCAFVAVVLRAFIGFMHFLLSNPTEKEWARETLKPQKPTDNAAYAPVSTGGIKAEKSEALKAREADKRRADEAARLIRGEGELVLLLLSEGGLPPCLISVDFSGSVICLMHRGFCWCDTRSPICDGPGCLTQAGRTRRRAAPRDRSRTAVAGQHPRRGLRASRRGVTWRRVFRRTARCSGSRTGEAKRKSFW